MLLRDHISSLPEESIVQPAAASSLPRAQQCPGQMRPAIPTAPIHQRRVRNTWTVDSGCCAYTQNCLHTPRLVDPEVQCSSSHFLPKGLLSMALYLPGEPERSPQRRPG